MAWDFKSNSNGDVFFKDGDIEIVEDSYNCDLNTANNYLQSKRTEYAQILIDTGAIYLLYIDLDTFLKNNAPSVAIINVLVGDGSDGDLGMYRFELGKA